ncbi:MAG: GTPase HflX [Candidatus Omnitrophota bacterium]
MPGERAYLVVVKLPRYGQRVMDEMVEEMTELILAANGRVVGMSKANLENPHPAFLVRGGKLAEIRSQAQAAGAQVIIFNCDLNPVQARNIESETGIRAVDRTGLILDIFARRAQSRDGKLQVELAQLEYLMPRLVGQGVIMSRLGGGIGTRGPGEQKLEVDRRKIRDRILRLKKEVAKLEQHRRLLRSGRQQKGLFQAALVGYTNAGKSTLLNALTGAGTFVQDRLFATLDPKTRVQKISGGADILFTDTVGFIRDLPHQLIDAFRATLEETAEADLLLHVLDASSEYRDEHQAVVEKTLAEIHASAKPVITVLNKIDQIGPEACERLRARFPEAVLISAREGTGLEVLTKTIAGFCAKKYF